MCQNITEATVQHSSESYVVFCVCFEGDNPSHSKTQRVVGVYILRAVGKLAIHDLTCRVILTQLTVL